MVPGDETFIDFALRQAWEQHPELIKAEVVKLLRQEAKLQEELNEYRRRFGPLLEIPCYLR